MSSTPSSQLLESTRQIRERILAHPFVRGIGDGTLPLEPFAYYVRQDYVYLVEYGRVLALGVASAHDLDVMELFAELVHATLHVEMELHRGYCERFGISRDDLESTPVAPATHAYTRHLLSVAYGGTTAELMAALLPCQWGYWEIGHELAEAGLPSHQPLYADWIEMYSSAEYEELADRLRATFDRVAACASNDEWPACATSSWPAVATNTPSGTHHSEWSRLARLIGAVRLDRDIRGVIERGHRSDTESNENSKPISSAVDMTRWLPGQVTQPLGFQIASQQGANYPAGSPLVLD